MSALAYSREASRKVTVSSSSPSKAMVTIMPGATTPSAAGASPTLAFSRSWVSWRTRSSCLPCSSLAAWYPPFSRRSPSSRAAAILAAISVRAGPDRYSSSALSWLYASWVSQVTLSLVWVTGAPRRYWDTKHRPTRKDVPYRVGETTSLTIQARKGEDESGGCGVFAGRSRFPGSAGCAPSPARRAGRSGGGAADQLDGGGLGGGPQRDHLVDTGRVLVEEGVL